MALARALTSICQTAPVSWSGGSVRMRLLLSIRRRRLHRLLRRQVGCGGPGELALLIQASEGSAAFPAFDIAHFQHPHRKQVSRRELVPVADDFAPDLALKQGKLW